jgi:hypothetical protein
MRARVEGGSTEETRLREGSGCSLGAAKLVGNRDMAIYKLCSYRYKTGR